METALYLPVKRFLEKRGFVVKGEVGGCDLVALSGDDPPIVVIGELKLAFNLELLLQAVDRAGACDEVWLAAKLSARGKGRESDARYRNLCRRLGFGMLAVTNSGDVEVLDDAGEVVATLGDGNFFGEISLLMSAPRTATVRANSYCDLYMLDKSDFTRVLRDRPKVAQSLMEIATKRYNITVSPDKLLEED